MDERHKPRFPVTGKELHVSQAPARRSIRSGSRSQPRSTGAHNPRLVELRHHASVWVAPALLLIAALLPWPYGYYGLLRLVVFVVCGWMAYEQWRFDDAVSGWVVAFGGVALLYNPFIPVHLTREIWSVVNIATAVLFLAHLRALKGLIRGRPSGRHQLLARPGRRIRSLIRRLSSRWSPGVGDVTLRDEED